MSVLDKLSKVQAARPQGGAFARVKGIFHQWKVGNNRLRLAGEFTEVRTHFIAPSHSPKRKDRGLCLSVAFQGDDKLPQVINCLNWDIAMERPKKEKICPVCKLNAVARAILAEKPNPEEKAFFEGLRQATRATSTLKWNVLDRDDPFVEVDNNGKAEKVLGFKIASIGPEAATDILGIFKQVGYDIQDPDKGIDIEVTRDDGGQRTTYSARAVIEGTSLKVTPFTKEERALVLNDLKVRCGKQVEASKILDSLHEDLRQILNVDVVEDSELDADANAAVEAAVAEVSEPAPAPAPATRPAQRTAAPQTRPVAPAATPVTAPSASKVPTSVLSRLKKQPVATAPVTSTEDAAIQEAIDEEDEMLPDGTDAKKKVITAENGATPVLPESAPTSKVVANVSVAPVVNVTPTDYVCFGTIDTTHPECQKCLYKEECVAEMEKRSK
jgi:hypothetical protein